MDPQTDNAQKPLEELVRELPPELHTAVRQSIELLLAHYAWREEKPASPELGPDAEVSLREITADTVRAICRLTDTLLPPRKYFVAPNAVSIAQAYFQPKAWFRAIYADETPVGFVMLYDDPEGEPPDNEPVYFLWRFMIAQQHQGKDFGRQAIGLLVDYAKTRPGAKELEASCGEGPGSPEGFYRKLGFERSGKMYDDEVGIVLKF
jgi:diamine N-acetyltransferase